MVATYKTPPSKNILDLRGGGQALEEYNAESIKLRDRLLRQREKETRRDYKKQMAKTLDARFDANKRGEPDAHRRRINVPAWYSKERFGYKRPDDIRTIRKK